MAPSGKHKSLAGSFGGAAAPERGSKLQGLLSVPARPIAPPGESEDGVDGGAVAPAGEAEQAGTPAAQRAVHEPAVVAERKASPGRRTRVGEGRASSAASVYLAADTYKQLTVTKSRRIKDYAQIVQDAFAQVAREAADQKTSPEEVLAGLFEVPEDNDEWLMPSSTARSKSATPLTEARISFSAKQRAWIEDKMTVVGRPVTFSEFVARVLDHHLVPAKRRAG